MDSGKVSNIKLRIVYMVSDFIMTSLAFFLFNIVRYNVIVHGTPFDILPVGYLLETKIIIEQIFIPIVLMAVYAISGYYNTPYPRSRLSEFIQTFYSAAFNSLVIFMVLLINDPTPRRRMEYMLIFTLFLILFLCTYSGRLLITTLTSMRVRKRKVVYKTVIIGNSPKSRRTAKEILQSRSAYNNVIAGYVPVEGEMNVFDSEKTIDRKGLHAFCRENGVNQIVISLEKHNDAAVLGMTYELIDLNIPIRIAPNELSFAFSGINTTNILGETFIDLTKPRLSEFSANLKRVTDVAVSSVVLLMLSPFLAVIAAAVKLSSPGPAIYSQERLGKKHVPFRIYKFRSMRCDAEKSGPQLSSDNDPRITPIGRFLRKYRIDEIPQFYNVLKGDMSIVGPRPEREYFIRQIVEHVPYYSLVHQVKPGITSWAMVKFGYASSLQQMIKRTQYDMVYISNMSLILDLKIILYTVKTVFTGAGV